MGEQEQEISKLFEKYEAMSSAAHKKMNAMNKNMDTHTKDISYVVNSIKIIDLKLNGKRK